MGSGPGAGFITITSKSTPKTFTTSKPICLLDFLGPTTYFSGQFQAVGAVGFVSFDWLTLNGHHFCCGADPVTVTWQNVSWWTPKGTWGFGIAETGGSLYP